MQYWNSDWFILGSALLSIGLFLVVLLIVVRREKRRSAQLENLAHSERRVVERFERLSADAGIVFWLIDLKSGQIEGNSLWRNRWGYSAGETITRESFFSRISPLFRERVQGAVDQVIKTREAFIITELGQSKPIAGSWQRLRFSPAFDASDELTTIEITAVDVSAEINMIKNAEAQQRREQQMYAVIGHELRTPASILKMQMENAARHQNSIDTELFNNTLDQLIDVIDTLRTVSQPEQIANAQLRTVMLSDLISSQISVLKTLTDEHNIELRSNYQQLPNILLRLPVGPLKQLISNLVRNAVIHAQCKVVDLSVQVEESIERRMHLTLEISDDGRGISTEDIERLFKPYERGEETFNGSGLGLHVCKTIAELMGGNLSFKPNTKGGASFILDWEAELATESDLTTEQSDDPNAVLPGLSVLLVEDDNAILQMTAMMLSDYGVKVRIAKNGLEALQVFNESQTDLVLTDIFMPKMSGVELTEELRRQGTERPIIGLTAATLGQETEAISRAGANAVLNKPLNPVDLARTVSRVAPLQ